MKVSFFSLSIINRSLIKITLRENELTILLQKDLLLISIEY